MKQFTILAIFLYIIFGLVQMAHGEDEHISRGKFLQSLSKYDNGKVHKDFVKSRRGRSVGFQSFITVLPQGASLSATAVISGDRRYVRIGVQPFFSTIGEINTFNFGRTNK